MKAVFPDVGQFLEALSCLRSRKDGQIPFPATVHLDPEGARWAVDMSWFKEHGCEVVRLSSQGGWNCREVSDPEVKEWRAIARAQFAAQAVQRCRWRRRDPFRERTPRGTGLHASRHRASSGSLSEPCIVIGTKDAQDAQSTLEVLTELQVGGVGSIVWECQTSGQETHGYRFFWCINLSETPVGWVPPLAYLPEGTRVWSGPVQPIRGERFVYLHWPYALEARVKKWITDLPWEAPEPAAILLSESPPQVLTLLGNRAGPMVLPAPYRMRMCGTPPRAPLVATSGPLSSADAPQFDVHLRLRRGSSRHVTQDALSLLRAEKESLERQVKMKAHAIEQIQRGQQTPLRRCLPPEPLYLFPTTTSGVPPEMERLLIEWIDQDEFLNGLRYAKVAGLERTQEPALDMHVLTTAAALRLTRSPEGVDPASALDTGLRLRSYAPTGRMLRFKLARDWLTYGLCLFVPEEDHLELKPLLQPGKYAAAKLAAAFLGPSEGEQDYTLWCFVLMPSDDEQSIRVQRIRRADFVPYTDIRSGHLRCNVVPTLLHPGKDVTKIAELMLDTFFGEPDEREPVRLGKGGRLLLPTGAVSREIGKAVDARLARVYAEWRGPAARLREELDKLRETWQQGCAEYRKLRRDVTEREKKVADGLQKYSDGVSELAGQVDHQVQEATRLKDAAASAADAAARLKEAQTRAARLQEKIREVEKELGALKQEIRTGQKGFREFTEKTGGSREKFDQWTDAQSR